MCWFVAPSERSHIVDTFYQCRHSFEYLDRDEMIVAHMVGGIDAFIRLAQGWPIASAPLNLLTLKSSSNYSKEISLSFLCKVVVSFASFTSFFLTMLVFQNCQFVSS